MEKARIIEMLIKEKGYSIRSFAQKCDIPETTLYTILKNGVRRASVDTVITICKNLGITVNQLDEMATGESIGLSYDDFKELLETAMARGGKTITTEQKLELIKILMDKD